MKAGRSPRAQTPPGHGGILGRVCSPVSHVLDDGGKGTATTARTDRLRVHGQEPGDVLLSPSEVLCQHTKHEPEASGMRVFEGGHPSLKVHRLHPLRTTCVDEPAVSRWIPGGVKALSRYSMQLSHGGRARVGSGSATAGNEFQNRRGSPLPVTAMMCATEALDARLVATRTGSCLAPSLWDRSRPIQFRPRAGVASGVESRHASVWPRRETVNRGMGEQWRMPLARKAPSRSSARPRHTFHHLSSDSAERHPRIVVSVAHLPLPAFPTLRHSSAKTRRCVSGSLPSARPPLCSSSTRTSAGGHSKCRKKQRGSS